MLDTDLCLMARTSLAEAHAKRDTQTELARECSMERPSYEERPSYDGSSILSRTSSDGAGIGIAIPTTGGGSILQKWGVGSTSFGRASMDVAGPTSFGRASMDGNPMLSASAPTWTIGSSPPLMSNLARLSMKRAQGRTVPTTPDGMFTLE